MKTKILTTIAALVTAASIAAPHNTLPPPLSHRPALRPTSMQHHHHHSVWGKGGSHFWPGFTGSFIGSLLVPTVAQPLPPPPRPVVYVKQIWVPPVYELRPMYDIYGRIVGYKQVIVVPGYWK